VLKTITIGGFNKSLMQSHLNATFSFQRITLCNSSRVRSQNVTSSSPAIYPPRPPSTLLLLLWSFGSFSGHGLLAVGVLRQLKSECHPTSFCYEIAANKIIKIRSRNLKPRSSEIIYNILVSSLYESNNTQIKCTLLYGLTK
jgi:hypothetical protein